MREDIDGACCQKISKALLISSWLLDVTRSQSCMFLNRVSRSITRNMFGSSHTTVPGHMPNRDKSPGLYAYIGVAGIGGGKVLEFGSRCVVYHIAFLKYAERGTHHVQVGQDSMGGGSCLVAETLDRSLLFSEILSTRMIGQSFRCTAVHSKDNSVQGSPV